MTHKLSDISSAKLDEASVQLTFRAGELVYLEGERPVGAYIVKSGTVKLTASSRTGKALILRIAKPGDVIGLSTALSDRRNDTSAVAQDTVALAYVTTQHLYQVMTCCTDISVWFAQQLSIEYFSLCRELSLLGLRRSAMSKLAKLLLDLSGNGLVTDRHSHVKCGLTHEELAQMIGISRETVTRLLRELRESAIATLKGKALHVNDLEQLRALMQ